MAMALITELQFAHECGALAYTLNELPDTAIRLIPETSTEPEQSTYFLRFDSTQQAEIRRVLIEDHTVSTIVSMPGSETQKLWGIEFTEETELLNPFLTEQGGFVLQARSATMDSGRRGWHEYWLLPDRQALHTVWQHALDANFEFEILQFRQWEEELTEQTLTRKPTEKQLTALTLAYEKGYFTEPRETDLKELAGLLGISPSAVAGRLKRGMRLLIEESLIEPDQER